MHLGSTNPIIGLDVPSGVSPIDIDMVENPPISNPDLKKQVQPDYNQELTLKLQEWDKLITDKKSLMTVILEQCNDATKTNQEYSRDIL